MPKLLDRACVLLLVLAGAGHAFIGTLMSSPLNDTATLWSFSGSIAVWAIAVLNWLRIDRARDKTLAFWAIIGVFSWAALMVWLMAIADMWGDWRPWSFIALCSLLAISNARSLVAPPGADASPSK